jgi:hypothetical protein
VVSLTDPKTGVRLARHPIGRCASGRFHVRVTPYGRPMLYWHGELSSMGIFSHDLANLIDWKHLAQQHTIQQSALQRPRLAFYVLARLPPADYSIETDPDGGETLYRVEPYRSRIYLRRPGQRPGRQRAPTPGDRRLET